MDDGVVRHTRVDDRRRTGGSMEVFVWVCECNWIVNLSLGLKFLVENEGREERRKRTGHINFLGFGPKLMRSIERNS